MEGSTELAKLAELLRVGATTVRQVALIRPSDADEIEGLAKEAERMAEDLDLMVARGERATRRSDGPP